MAYHIIGIRREWRHERRAKRYGESEQPLGAPHLNRQALEIFLSHNIENQRYQHGSHSHHFVGETKYSSFIPKWLGLFRLVCSP